MVSKNGMHTFINITVIYIYIFFYFLIIILIVGYITLMMLGSYPKYELSGHSAHQ